MEGSGATSVCVNSARLTNTSAVTDTASSYRGSDSDHSPGTGKELQKFQYGLAAGRHTDTNICGCMVRIRLSGD